MDQRGVRLVGRIVGQVGDESLQNDPILLFSPGRLLDLGIQLVVPSLPAVFACTLTVGGQFIMGAVRCCGDFFKRMKPVRPCIKAAHFDHFVGPITATCCAAVGRTVSARQMKVKWMSDGCQMPTIRSSSSVQGFFAALPPPGVLLNADP